MNILVIGSGGREHAVIHALVKKSASVHQIYCAPGNAGIAEQAEIVFINIKNHSEVIQFCKSKKMDLVFIGPEDPLVQGLSDALRMAHINVFGPSKEAAQLEGSKIFSKQFMQEAQVPTAASDIVDSVEETMKAAPKYTAPYILKADGLAAGKGVFICKNLDELQDSADKIFNQKILGDAGCRALLEQNLQINSSSKEISFLILTNGSEFQTLPLAQDHKRLLDNNKGPNTGGMGTVAPMQIESELYDKIIEHVVKPTVTELKKRNYLYRGVVFIGLMIVDNNPYVLEYNVRFGDPETQVILPLIDNDIAELFYELSQGRLQKIKFNQKSAVCIVNAAKGYPDQPVKGTPITLPNNSDDAYILHAGTSKVEKNDLVSSGGRVLNIIAVEKNLALSRDKAYKLNALINFPDRQFRTDIGNYI